MAYAGAPIGLLLLGALLASAPAQAASKDKHARSQSAPAAAKPSEPSGPATPAVEATIALTGLGGDGLAVFVRNGILWVAAEGENANLQPKVTGSGARDLGALERVQVPGATVFRVPIPGTLVPIVSRPGKDWQVDLARQAPDLPLPDSAIVDDRGYLELSIAMAGVGAPISIQDTDVGDTLIVAPAPLGAAYSRARHLAEFEILPAAQGLVVNPHADGVAVVADDDRATIGTPAGLKLSAIPLQAARNAEKSPTGPSASAAMALATPVATEIRDGRILLDWIGWHLPIQKPDEQRRDLEHHAAVLDDSRKAPVLLDLARLSLSQGKAPEGLGYLSLAIGLVPDLEAKDDVRALRAAAQVLLGRTEEAKPDLTHAGVDGTSDSVLWQGLASARSGDWPAALTHFKAAADRLPAYPDDLFRPLALAAIEAAIRGHEIGFSKRVLSELRARPDPAKLTQAALAYFDGQIAALEGKDEEAQADWKPVLSGRDQYYRTRAELASVLAGLKSKDVTPEAAIDRLYRLQFTWRGDDFETEVLQILADTADGSKDYETAQAAWRRIASLSGPGPVADAAHDKLVETFRKLFIDGGADPLPPMRALALFDMMHDLAPTGPDGDKALDRLADRMVEMDLLSQAADILEGEMGRQADIQAKGKLGARVAALRLLDEKPELAVRALDASENAQVSSDLQGSRRLLRARAFSKENRADEALSLLGSDTAKSADELRVDVAWAGQRWHVASEALGRLVGPPAAPGTMDDAKAALVIRRAIALNMDNDKAGLAVLRRDFAASFAQGKHASEFEVLTRPSGDGALANLDIIKSEIAVVDMFKDFLAAYRTRSSGA